MPVSTSADRSLLTPANIGSMFFGEDQSSREVSIWAVGRRQLGSRKSRPFCPTKNEDMMRYMLIIHNDPELHPQPGGRDGTS